jgi:hypothetical protein
MVYPKSPSAKATNKAAVCADKEARTRQAVNRQLSIYLRLLTMKEQTGDIQN